MSVGRISVHEALSPNKGGALYLVKGISGELFRVLYVGPLVFEKHRNSDSYFQAGLMLE